MHIQYNLARRREKEEDKGVYEQSFLQMYNLKLCRWAKMVMGLLNKLLLQELVAVRTCWAVVYYLEFWRTFCTRWRGEKWIRKWWSSCELSMEEWIEMENRGWVYVRMNIETR